MNEGKETKTSVWKNVMHDPLLTRQVFIDNEIRANLLIAKTMLAAAGVILICWFLNAAGVLEISHQYVLPIFLVGSVGFLIPAAVALAYRGERGWIKYMLIGSSALVLAYMDSLLTYNAPLLIVFPVIFSCRYYSGSITVRTAFVSSVLFAVSAWCGARFGFNSQDLNFAGPELQAYVRDIMLMSFLPRWMTSMVISAFCFGVARYGREMVLEQDAVSQKTARVNTELEMAGNIQSQALPTADSLPEEARSRFDLAAEMIPAKEVGGDFYDFFCPDDSHIALIIADVADKGIAASLYMMMAKTLLKSRLSFSLSPQEVLESVNRDLAANSPRGMFVTVWLGILDLETGELRAANAGHEYPVLKRADGDFELIKDRHGFVLGGMKTSKYPGYSVRLGKGDTLFVYTDGVPEANDADGRMFGTERMLEALNRHKDCGMKELIDGVLSDIRLFTGSAAQFDDITMLAFRPQIFPEENVFTVRPELDQLYPVEEYIRKTLGEDELSDEQQQKLGIAVDEIFSNIVKYSQANEVQILCGTDKEQCSVTFRDDGVPFDPLTEGKTVPTVPKKPGGLGIYIVRKIMDGVEYNYRDGRNELTVTLNKKEKQNEDK